ncbi:MAG: protein kinase domain-containing protein [Hyphomicrobiaceae bacterium]
MELREPLRTGVMLAGEYRIDQVLGAGGFGITYLAEDIKLKMPVAIKEYFPAEFGLRDASQSVRARSGELGETFRWGLDSFLKEAQLLARFDHPAITRVMRVMEANNTAYMVLRYEEGLPLKQHLETLARPMTEAEVRTLIYPLLEALDVLHAQAVLHRDISPDNIIVRPDGRGVLIDFGASRRAIADKSQALTGIVREGYSPPEQFGSGGRQGPWTDIYALGAVLYQTISGAKPPTSIHRILDDQLVAAATLGAGRYSDGLLAAVDQALRLKPATRPQSLAAFRHLFAGPAAGALAPAAGAALAAEPANIPVIEVPTVAHVQAPPVPPAQLKAKLPAEPPAASKPFTAAWMPLPKLLFSFSGRINRAKVWLGFLMMFLIIVAAFCVTVGISTAVGEINKSDLGPVTGTCFAVIAVLWLWMTFAIYAKRAHDRNWTGWFSLLLMVPVICMWPLIELIFLPGDPGPNRFGASPLASK